ARRRLTGAYLITAPRAESRAYDRAMVGAPVVATDIEARTSAAAVDVVKRAARDGERVVCTARLALAVTTVIAWPIFASGRPGGFVAADVVVILMSAGSLVFSAGVIFWLRGDRVARNSFALRTVSIGVDCVLVIGGLAMF